jgi:thiamine monophosphate synthase
MSEDGIKYSMTKINTIRTAALVGLLAALPIGLIAQTQTTTSQEQLGAVTASPVAMEPSVPVTAVSGKSIAAIDQLAEITQQTVPAIELHESNPGGRLAFGAALPSTF